MIVLSWPQKRVALLRKLAELDTTAAKAAEGAHDRWLEADKIEPSVPLRPQPQPKAPAAHTAPETPEIAHPHAPEPPQPEEAVIETPATPESLDIQVETPTEEPEPAKSLASYLDD